MVFHSVLKNPHLGLSGDQGVKEGPVGWGFPAGLPLTWTDWAREMKVKPDVTPATSWQQVCCIFKETDSCAVSTDNPGMK